MAFGEIQMHTNPQLLEGAQSGDGRVTVGHIGQQTGAAEPPLPVQIEDGLIDGRRVAQVISVEEQFHGVSGDQGIRGPELTGRGADFGGRPGVRIMFGELCPWRQY